VPVSIRRIADGMGFPANLGRRAFQKLAEHVRRSLDATTTPYARYHSNQGTLANTMVAIHYSSTFGSMSTYSSAMQHQVQELRQSFGVEDLLGHGI